MTYCLAGVGLAPIFLHLHRIRQNTPELPFIGLGLVQQPCSLNGLGNLQEVSKYFKLVEIVLHHEWYLKLNYRFPLI